MEENISPKRWQIGAVICFVITLLIPVLAFIGFSMTTVGKIDIVKLNKSNLSINTSVLPAESVEKMAGKTNIAIFGLDNRYMGAYSGGNSDVIMIASIDNETKDVKLVSIYRDTLLDVGESYGGLTKCNAAYARGGAEAAVAMLNKNLDLDITQFVAVDWKAVTEVVDALGGITIDIDQSEVQYINFYINEINEKLGRNSANITRAGKQNLDGVQATAFCRIRYTEGSDFRRAMRHRIVLETMLKKAKTEDLATLVSIINTVAGDISTSMELNEMISMAMDVTKYNIVETTGFPFKLTSETIYCGSTDIPLGLEENVSKLHTFLFDDTEYVASDVVKQIDKAITDATGYDANSYTDYNMDKYNDTVGKDNAFE